MTVPRLSGVGTSFLALLVSVAPASAQWRGGTMREFNFNNPMSALAATMVMNKAREDALAKRLGMNSNSGKASANSNPTQAQ